MGQYFSADYAGVPFRLFGTAHIGALGALIVLNLFLVRFGHANETIRRWIRWSFAFALILNELAWHAWNIAVGTWSLQTMLPLHLCSVFVWVTAIMLLTRKYRLYEFAYFLGIGGAAQILITPDLGIYGFPHFRFFQTFLSHGLVVTAAIYMTVVERYRPTWSSLR
ncbi:MAG TPA: TIGR02206 family membrane protein, partial [Anaerolineales bacterium]